MAIWANIKLFYDSITGADGSLLTATSAEAANPIENIHSWLETNWWKGSTAADPHGVMVDTNTGSTRTADYLIIMGHNLNTVGATVVLQHSTTGAWAGEEVDAFTPEAPAADTVYMKEFTQTAAQRYWRVKFTGHSAAIQAAIIAFGDKTELAKATASFDPYQQEDEAVVNRTQGGYVAGIHQKYTDRQINFMISPASLAVYQKVKTWRETHGMKQLFIAWETANNPADVWLVMPDTAFNNPFRMGAGYRDISFSLRGRKE